ncbi:MAG TPA: phage baseplate assembly protein V [Chthoniobacteraceae bacterium]|jgi:hypothetical protein|nr:phage baseplate assembly protein V [Chthoniobacteraceae bacterium]
MSSPRKYYGKFRGTVFNNIDPEQRGRIMAIVPAVSKIIPTSWAMPCVPMAGKEQGFFMVPQLGSGVWMEFEEGDPDKPIWVGGFWGVVAEVPKLALLPPAVPPGQTVVLQTTGQNALVLSDSPPTPLTGGIVLKSTLGASIVVNDAGIFIQNGKGASITLVANAVTINNGALAVI